MSVHFILMTVVLVAEVPRACGFGHTHVGVQQNLVSLGQDIVLSNTVNKVMTMSHFMKKLHWLPAAGDI